MYACVYVCVCLSVCMRACVRVYDCMYAFVCLYYIINMGPIYFLVGCVAAVVLLSIVITIFLVRKFKLYPRSPAHDTMITPEATSLTVVHVQEHRRGGRSELVGANSGTSINQPYNIL